MDLELRPTSAEEFAEFDRVCSAAFGEIPSPEATELDRRLVELDRTLAAVVDGAIVGTALTHGFGLTLPGGLTVPAAGVADVGVLGTHRRRGILRAMMARLLDDAAARGEAVAILMASEPTIYGRFGFGPASEAERVSVAADHPRFAHLPPARSLRLVPRELAAPLVAPVYEAVRATRPGWLTRTDAWWEAILGEVRTWKGGGPAWVAVAEPEDPAGGGPVGYVVYERVSVGEGHPGRVEVRELVAVDDGTEAALWRYCLELDLVGEVVAACPPDDPLRWWLADPRQVRVLHRRDGLWVRLLDVAAALSARRYRHDGTLVVEVHDPFRPATSGRYHLRVDGGEAVCERLADDRGVDPDLRLGVAELGSLYLGGVAASTLARARRLEEVRSGAVATADALFGWDRLPFCPTRF